MRTGRPMHKRRDSPRPLFVNNIHYILSVEYQIYNNDIDAELIQLFHEFKLYDYKFNYHEYSDIRDITVNISKAYLKKNISLRLTELQQRLKNILVPYQDKMSNDELIIISLKELINSSKELSNKFKDRKFPIPPKINLITQAEYFRSYGSSFK